MKNENLALALLNAGQAELAKESQDRTEFGVREAARYLGISVETFQGITRVFKIKRDVKIPGPKKGDGRTMDKYSRELLDSLKAKIESFGQETGEVEAAPAFEE